MTAPILNDFPPLAGNIRDASKMVGRSRNYLYDLHRRGLLPIHTDPLRPRVRTIIYSELLAAIRQAAAAG